MSLESRLERLGLLQIHREQGPEEVLRILDERIARREQASRAQGSPIGEAATTPPSPPEPPPPPPPKKVYLSDRMRRMYRLPPYDKK